MTTSECGSDGTVGAFVPGKVDSAHEGGGRAAASRSERADGGTDRTIAWDFPIPRTHCGVALGNGRFGMLVWGTDRLHLTVNSADFWDHRHGEVVPEGATYEKVKAVLGVPDEAEAIVRVLIGPNYVPLGWKSSRLPMGRFELDLMEGVKLKRAVLQLDCGWLRIEMTDGSGCEKTVSLAMAIGEDVVALRDPEGIVKKVHVRTAWGWAAEDLRTRGIEAAEEVDGETLNGWVQPLPEDPAMAALCCKSRDGYLICLSRGRENKEAKAAGLDLIMRCEKEGMSSIFSSTEQWWRRFWQDTPKVCLPSEFFNRFTDYALYKFGCATTPESSIPAGLQGPWAEEYQMPPWSGDYHFNVNIQQIYTLALAANRPAHLLPLFNMLESEPFRSVMRQTAKRLFGIDDGLVLTHAVDDRGRQCGGLGIGSVLDQACGGWTAQLYWLYYQYTGDVNFLRSRAYPFMYGIMRSYEAMLEKHQGRYFIPVSISAEYSRTDEKGQSINYGRSPSYQLACIHMLLDALFEGCAILGIEPRAVWRDIKENLPLYTRTEGEEGPQIAIWEGVGLEVCHRHHSHLACIYPFDSLGEMTAEKLAVVGNSVDHWIAKGMGKWSEWCIPWAIILHSRLGFTESPRLLLELWKDIFINEGLATVYLPRLQGITAHRREDMLKPKATHEIMQLDGTMAGVTALYEMLVHCRGGVIHLFPGISEQWRDLSFRKIGLPGAARISAERREGQTVWVELESLRGGTYRLAAGNLHEAMLTVGRKTQRVTLPFSIELEPGQVAGLRRIV